MFVFHYSPHEIYPHLGNPKREAPTSERIEPNTPLARAFQTVSDAIGTGLSVEMFYFPMSYSGQHDLGQKPNSYIYQIIGSCAAEGHDCNPGDVVKIDGNIVEARPIPGSPCVFARLAFDTIQETTQVATEHELVKQILVEDYLSPETCDKIISSLYTSGNDYGKVLTNAKENTTAKMLEYRKTEIMRSRDDPFVRSVLADIIAQKVEPFFDTTIEFWNEPVLLKYEVGGFFVAHTDGEIHDPESNTWSRIYDRDYTLVAFLNENYEGGELSFPDLNFVVTPKRGRIVAFPADHRFRHGAEKTTLGTRFQLVSWLTAYGTVRTNTPPNPTVIFRTW